MFYGFKEQVAKMGTGYESSKSCAEVQQIFEIIEIL